MIQGIPSRWQFFWQANIFYILQVISGDTIIIIGVNTEDAKPKETTVTLMNIRAPKFGNKKKKKVRAISYSYCGSLRAKCKKFA